MNKDKFFLRVLIIWVLTIFCYIGYFFLSEKPDLNKLETHSFFISVFFTAILSIKLLVDKLIIYFINKVFASKLSKVVDSEDWEYGTCCLTKARRHKETKVIEIYFSEDHRLNKAGWYSVEIFDGAPFIPDKQQLNLFKS